MLSNTVGLHCHFNTWI